MKILHLTLKKKWFELIVSGEKLEEYREIKPYWTKRLAGLVFGKLPVSIAYIKCGLELQWKIKNEKLDTPWFDMVKFKNGYSTNAPWMIVECKGIEIGTAKPEWSDNWQGEVYVIRLGKIIEISPF